MIKKTKRVLTFAVALITSAAMVFPAFPTSTVNAGTYDSAVKSIRRQFEDKNRDPFAYRTSRKSVKKKYAKGTKDFPEKLDLRDYDGKCYVTPVRFQNPFGSCWGFAAIASAETSLLASGLAEQDGYDEKTLNLSEKHLINFLVRPIDDKNNPQYGEGMHFKNSSMSLEEKFNHGGVPVFATSLFASGIGPNLEDRSVEEEYDKGIYEYHGINKEIQKVKANGKWINYCYSNEDDWSIPEALRFKQSYMLKESYMLPTPAGTDEEGMYKYNQDGTDAIKDMLVNKRAVEIGFCADNSMPDDENEGQYISSKWAHYTYSNEDPANHAVTIIGWDDSYSKENFIEGHQPPKDGAWLVKNSWGSGEVDFPDKGTGDWGIPNEEGKGTGYFWLSYYDQSLSKPEALSFDKSNVGSEYYLDQHDYMPVDEVVTADIEQKAEMANVFTAEASESLEAISCQTSAPGTTVEYKIYILNNSFTSPEDGVVVASGSKSFEYGGFHKIALDNPVLIQKGQHYAIGITEIGMDGLYNVNLQAAFSKEVSESMDLDNWVVGVVNPKESFLCLDGKWVDYSKKSFLKSLFGQMYSLFTVDNFPIKGYASKRPNIRMSISPSDKITLMPLGEESKSAIRVDFRGDESAFPDSDEITWEVSEGSENIFDLKVDEKNNARAVVSVKKAGSGYIKVSAEGVGTSVIAVKVSRYGKYMESEVKMEYGESDELTVMDSNFNQVSIKGFRFKSSNTKVATVSKDGVVKGVGVGKAKISFYDPDGFGEDYDYTVIKATNNLKVKGKTVKLKASALKKKNVVIKKAKAYSVKNNNGKLAFKLKSVSNKKFAKYFKVNAKNGKITVKKKLKKGTYKITVNIKAAGDKNHKAVKKKAVVTVIVK